MGNSRGEQEKAVQKWLSEMQGTIQPEERRREARERTTMEQEGSNSWEKLWGPRILVPSPLLAPGNDNNVCNVCNFSAAVRFSIYYKSVMAVISYRPIVFEFISY